MSSWIFPAPVTGLQLPAWGNAEFNSTVSGYLVQQASTSATTGFGSNRAVFIEDIIEVHSDADTNYNVDRYCVVCTQPYSGVEGWPACDRFSPAASPQLHVTQLGRETHFEYTLPELNDLQNVSAASCAFGVRTDSSYELSSAFPFINRRHDSGDGPYTYSEKQPTGMEDNALPTTTLNPSATGSSPTATVTPSYFSDPRGKLDSNRLSKGAITGIIVGTIIGVSIISCALFMYRNKQKQKRRASQALHMKKLSTSTTGTNGTAHVDSFLNVPAAPQRPSRPFVRDRLSDVERGQVPWRQDTTDLPPPAYEEIVVSAARDAEREERARMSAPWSDGSADSRWSRTTMFDDVSPLSPNGARMAKD